jgi:hypothetical protein
MDHQGALLINDAIDPRMQQLRSFGLLVMPKVILPLLMTRVMASTILYDSEHFSSDVFKHSFDVLEGVVASYHEKGLSATTYKETRLSCGDWASGLGISWEIDSLLRDLTIKSSASPLFCRLMPELNANKGEVVVRENDAIWKGSMPQRRDTSKITPVAIPFVIIARINNALDGAVK